MPEISFGTPFTSPITGQTGAQSSVDNTKGSTNVKLADGSVQKTDAASYTIQPPGEIAHYNDKWYFADPHTGENVEANDENISAYWRAHPEEIPDAEPAPQPDKAYTWNDPAANNRKIYTDQYGVEYVFDSGIDYVDGDSVQRVPRDPKVRKSWLHAKRMGWDADAYVRNKVPGREEDKQRWEEFRSTSPNQIDPLTGRVKGAAGSDPTVDPGATPAPTDGGTPSTDQTPSPPVTPAPAADPWSAIRPGAQQPAANRPALPPLQDRLTDTAGKNSPFRSPNSSLQPSQLNTSALFSPQKSGTTPVAGTKNNLGNSTTVPPSTRLQDIVNGRTNIGQQFPDTTPIDFTPKSQKPTTSLANTPQPRVDFNATTSPGTSLSGYGPTGAGAKGVPQVDLGAFDTAGTYSTIATGYGDQLQKQHDPIPVYTPTLYSDPTKGTAVGAVSTDPTKYKSTATNANTIDAKATQAQALLAAAAPQATAAQAQAQQAASINLGRTDDLATRQYQIDLLNQLAAASRGEGPSKTGDLLRTGANQQLRSSLAASATAGGNAALAQRRVGQTAAGLNGSLQQQLSSAKLDEMLQARQLLGTAAEQTRGQDLSAATTQAQLQQQKALQDATLGTGVSQSNAALETGIRAGNADRTSDVNKFNANLGTGVNVGNADRTTNVDVGNAQRGTEVNVGNAERTTKVSVDNAQGARALQAANLTMANAGADRQQNVNDVYTALQNVIATGNVDLQNSAQLTNITNYFNDRGYDDTEVQAALAALTGIQSTINDDKKAGNIADIQRAQSIAGLNISQQVANTAAAKQSADQTANYVGLGLQAAGTTLNVLDKLGAFKGSKSSGSSGGNLNSGGSYGVDW